MNWITLTFGVNSIPLGHSDFTGMWLHVFNKHEFQFSGFFFLSSPKSGSFLWGMVVPGRGGSSGTHLHSAASFHPHYQRTEQEVCKKVWIRWVHTVVQLSGTFNYHGSLYFASSLVAWRESDNLPFLNKTVKLITGILLLFYYFWNTEQRNWVNFVL